MRIIFRIFLIPLFMLLSCPSDLFGQNRFSYILSAGPNYYYGELNDGAPTHTKLVRPFFSLGLGFSLNNNLDITANYYWGSIAGADSLSSQPFNINRNLSFNSLISELSVRLEYKMFKGYKEKTINPFMYAGAGLFFFNPKAEFQGKNIELQPLGTEGQNSSDHPDGPYELTQSSVILGMGIYFRVNENLKIKVDAGSHVTFTDFLDDVSGTYPDSIKLANTSNGELAIQLSDRSNNTAYPPEGQVRGNSEANDGWIHFGIGIHYNIAGDKRFKSIFGRKVSCPAY